MHVIVASTNPVKIKVAELACAAVFPNSEIIVTGIETPSGVGDQPMGDETLVGAQNRLAYIQKAHPHADYYIAQEGGIWDDGVAMYNRAWILVSDGTGFVGKSATASLYLPKEIAVLVRAGDELGVAGDTFFNTASIKTKNGVIAEMTNGLIDRVAYYLQPAIIALSQVVHKDWY